MLQCLCDTKKPSNFCLLSSSNKSLYNRTFTHKWRLLYLQHLSWTKNDGNQHTYCYIPSSYFSQHARFEFLRLTKSTECLRQMQDKELSSGCWIKTIKNSSRGTCSPQIFPWNAAKGGKCVMHFLCAWSIYLNRSLWFTLMHYNL